mmetsp:Transcript_8110/g.25238  ORF Transcript_8110/g.25238 Transcript_8110/m.25238 type:complete len:144 (-) Transcript_8110:40-471(-)
MDGDSLFMNFSKPLELLLPTGSKSMTMSGDLNCMFNAGHFMLRRGAWASSLLEETWSLWPPPAPWDENSAMLYLLTGRQKTCRAQSWPCCRRRAVAACDERGQNEMNSYKQDYRPGDFIVHFAGAAPAEKAALMGAYARRAGQ